jgi:uncharacterized ferritin-like protein (DUF455 family)
LCKLGVILLYNPRRLATQRLERSGDKESVEVLRHNVEEEVGHVAAGVRWFSALCKHRGLEGTPEAHFHGYVRSRYKGVIRGPFNAEARGRAGMTPQWYEPLEGMSTAE